MNFLANVKMRYKLLLLLVVPLGGLLFFSISGVLEKYNLSNDIDDLLSLSVLSVRASDLVDELQKERGASALYLGSEGARFGPELAAQWDDTDKGISAIKTALNAVDHERHGPTFNAVLNSALDGLERLKENREAVRSLRVSVDDTLDYYTRINALFLGIITHISEVSSNAKLTRMIFAYVNFLQGKERAGLEQAVLSHAFAAGVFGPGMFERFSALVTAQTFYSGLFEAFATPEQKRFYEAKLTGPFVEETSRMRQLAFDKANEGEFGVDPARWFERQTGKIALLEQVENKLSNDLIPEAKDLQAGAMVAFYANVGVTLVVILVALMLAYVVSGSITRPLDVAVGVADSLARGDTSVELDVEATDEIGQLFAAMRNMVTTSRNMAAAAAAVAAGDLTVAIVAQSDKDVLGGALVGMVQSLRGMTQRIQEGVQVLSTTSSEIAAITAQLAASTSQIEISSEELKQLGQQLKQLVQHYKV